MSEQHAPLSEAEIEADTWASWWDAHAAQRDMYAAGITGMDVPTEPWTKKDTAYWTATARYQPWKDVAAFFRSRGDAAALANMCWGMPNDVLDDMIDGVA